MAHTAAAASLQDYLHRHIPLSRAMQVTVVSVAGDAVTLRAPLAPNINHRETVFGGSASALAILAAWSLLHTRLQAEGLAARLVIQRNTMAYEHPVCGDFTARAGLQDPGRWRAFTAALQRRGRARIACDAVVEYEGRPAGRFSGDFVALR